MTIKELLEKKQQYLEMAELFFFGECECSEEMKDALYALIRKGYYGRKGTSAEVEDFFSTLELILKAEEK